MPHTVVRRVLGPALTLLVTAGFFMSPAPAPATCAAPAATTTADAPFPVGPDGFLAAHHIGVADRALAVADGTAKPRVRASYVSGSRFASDRRSAGYAPPLPHPPAPCARVATRQRLAASVGRSAAPTTAPPRSA